ncbi:MAG: helix-turn-helix transcriptional regulator [Solirubrobacteraceae bacterium]
MSADANHDEVEWRLVILGQAIRGFREQRGVSTDRLAARTGKTPQRIRELEAGELDPGYEELGVLAEKGLGVRLSTLVAYAARRERRPTSP